jgi:prepilin-type N-terminal cleavage/methylation domain-containing protein
MKTRRQDEGMTLVEIMIVLAILGLLVSLGVPGFLQSRNKARKDTCVNNLRMIENAADQYRIDNNLALTKDTSILWLWPNSATTKDISSYINKQLRCPVSTNQYVGGTSAVYGISTTLPTDLNIAANGFPHCKSSTATPNANCVYGGVGSKNEHYIDNPST